MIRYDSAHRRLWMLGFRVHHGAAGSVAAAMGVGLCHKSLPLGIALVCAGSAAMWHDLADMSCWFRLEA